MGTTRDQIDPPCLPHADLAGQGALGGVPDVVHVLHHAGNLGQGPDQLRVEMGVQGRRGSALPLRQFPDDDLRRPALLNG